MLKTLLFPATCVGCLKELSTGTLCPDCVALLPPAGAPYCPRCKRRLPQNEVCAPCTSFLGFSRLFAAFPYRHPVVAALIDGLKYEGVREAVPLLGARLAQALAARSFEPKEVLVIPVPLHPRRLRERGFNQALLLSQDLAQRLDIPYENALKRRRETAQQAKLSRAERHHNVKDAFAVSLSAKIQRRNIVLVDDVITTGATMASAAQALYKARAKTIWAAVAAQG